MIVKKRLRYLTLSALPQTCAGAICRRLGWLPILLFGSFLGLPSSVRAQTSPTMPGDATWDWSVDEQDFLAIEDCWSGAEISLDPSCLDLDLDLDHDIDLVDLSLLQRLTTGRQFLSIPIADDADDGTEVDGTSWFPDGYWYTGLNLIGLAGTESCDLGLRFRVPDLVAGETIAYARLLLPATDDGYVESVGKLRISGVDADCVDNFELTPPSQLPKTSASVYWDFATNWPENAGSSDCYPLYRATEDLSPIINEILRRPDWGVCEDGRTLGLVVENLGVMDSNYLVVQDTFETENCPNPRHGPILQIFRTVPSTFLGREFLGRPTNDSVTIHALSLLTLDVFFEYGPQPGIYQKVTPVVRYPGGSPIEAVLDRLNANSRYFYRMRYKLPSESFYRAGRERSFVTQRAIYSTFTFTVTADSHITLSKYSPDGADLQALYRRTLRNVMMDAPDFNIDMGDIFFLDSKGGRFILDLQDAIDRDLLQRPFMDLIAHSSPYFCVLGNHEAEQGWRLDGTAENIAVWATLARKHIFPMPYPDAFYSGNTTSEQYVGIRENYYSWRWGNALFVVLDPYWYTTAQPYDDPIDGLGTRDNWDWTLGRTQYDWLVDTLENSNANFKFVFAHQVTGGVDNYGRGGAEAASHALGGTGSYEWGGEDSHGNYVFNIKRPGWGDPIQKVFVDNGVTIFFHGHDHVFVAQTLDDIGYQECPQPSDPDYEEGLYVAGHYWTGLKVNNSGHLRVTVTPAQVTVEYIRAYLLGDGDNGDLGHSYTISIFE